MKFMLAKIGSESILASDEYIFEPKLDGYRTQLIKNISIKLLSRGGRDITSDFPELIQPDRIAADSAVIDGEIVVYDKAGNPSFSLMQKRKAEGYPATYVAFDILSKNGSDLESLTLLERKKILAGTIIEGDHLQTIFFTNKGRQLFQEMKKRDLEGVIAKRKDSRYTPARSSAWLKIKLYKTADCIIIGYITERRRLSSLALGLFQNGAIKYMGKVGTGFSEIDIGKLLSQFKIISEANLPEEMPKNVIPVKPSLVCEVRYQELTRDLKLRAPVYLRLRHDKKPKDCHLEDLLPE